MSELVVVVPAYQVAGRIGEVVRGALAAGCPVVVVDDGSTDGTGDEAEMAGAKVLRHPRNHGKGAALVTGFALAERSGARAVATLDGDGQHDPAELPRLIHAHRADPHALVIGVRRLELDAMPRRSLIGNRISTWWISRFAGRPLRDSQSGFRIYPRVLWEGAALRSSHFDTETELLLLAAKTGLPLVEVPVQTLYPREHRTHFRNWLDTLRIIRLVVGSPLWRTPVRPEPRQPL